MAKSKILKFTVRIDERLVDKFDKKMSRGMKKREYSRSAFIAEAMQYLMEESAP